MLIIIGSGNSLSLKQDRPVQDSILVEVLYQIEQFRYYEKTLFRTNVRSGNWIVCSNGVLEKDEILLLVIVFVQK